LINYTNIKYERKLKRLKKDDSFPWEICLICVICSHRSQA